MQDSLLASLQQILPDMNSVVDLGNALEDLTQQPVGNLQFRREGPAKSVIVIRASASHKPAELLLEVSTKSQCDTLLCRAADLTRLNGPKRQANNCLPRHVPHPNLGGHSFGGVQLGSHIARVLSLEGTKPFFDLVATEAALTFRQEGRVTQDLHSAISQLIDAFIFMEASGLVHGNMCPQAARQRALTQGLPQLVLTDFGFAHQGQTACNKTKVGGSRRGAASHGLFKPVTWENSGMARDLMPLVAGQPGFRAPGPNSNSGADLFAVGVMCLLAFLSEHEGCHEEGLWTAVSKGELNQYVLERHRALRSSSGTQPGPGVEILELIVQGADLSVQRPPLQEPGLRLWLRKEISAKLLALASDLLTQGVTFSQAFQKAFISAYVATDKEEEGTLLYPGLLMPGDDSIGMKEAVLALHPRLGFVMGFIWDTKHDVPFCYYGGQKISRPSKGTADCADKFGTRSLAVREHIIDGKLDRVYTPQRYAESNGAGPFMSSSRKRPNVSSRTGNVARPFWNKLEPTLLSKDHSEDRGDAIYGIIMKTNGWSPRGSHACWDYDWAHGVGQPVSSQADVQKRMRDYEPALTPGRERTSTEPERWLDNIVDHWRAKLIVKHGGSRDDPKPPGESVVTCLFLLDQTCSAIAEQLFVG